MFIFFICSEGVRAAPHPAAAWEHEPGGGGDGEVPLHRGHDLHGLVRRVVQTQRQRYAQ